MFPEFHPKEMWQACQLCRFLLLIRSPFLDIHLHLCSYSLLEARIRFIATELLEDLKQDKKWSHHKSLDKIIQKCRWSLLKYSMSYKLTYPTDQLGNKNHLRKQSNSQSLKNKYIFHALRVWYWQSVIPRFQKDMKPKSTACNIWLYSSNGNKVFKLLSGLQKI